MIYACRCGEPSRFKLLGRFYCGPCFTAIPEERLERMVAQQRELDAMGAEISPEGEVWVPDQEGAELSPEAIAQFEERIAKLGSGAERVAADGRKKGEALARADEPLPPVTRVYCANCDESVPVSDPRWQGWFRSFDQRLWCPSCTHRAPGRSQRRRRTRL